MLGGSFNPAHDGHRHLSVAALGRLSLDEVWWLVTPQNPLKPRAGMAALTRRVALAATVASHPRIRVTAVEAVIGTRTTVLTLAALRRRYPRTRFVWLMGADNLVQIPFWSRWPAIFRAVPVAIFDRCPYALRALAGKAARRYAQYRQPVGKSLARVRPPAWSFVRGRCHPASATAIRAAGAHRLFQE